MTACMCAPVYAFVVGTCNNFRAEYGFHFTQPEPSIDSTKWEFIHSFLFLFFSLKNNSILNISWSSWTHEQVNKDQLRDADTMFNIALQIFPDEGYSVHPFNYLNTIRLWSKSGKWFLFNRLDGLHLNRIAQWLTGQCCSERNLVVCLKYILNALAFCFLFPLLAALNPIEDRSAESKLRFRWIRKGTIMCPATRLTKGGGNKDHKTVAWIIASLTG